MMEHLVSVIVAAVNARTLYPAMHPQVFDAVGSIVTALSEMCAERHSESITLLVIGDDLVFENDVVRTPTLMQRQFVEMLRRHGIERLTLADGIGYNECHDLVTALAAGETPQSSSHVILGRVKVALDGKGPDIDERQFPNDEFNVVRDAFSRFRIEGRMPLTPMENLVWGFIEALSQTTRTMLPLAKLKDHDEYTFVHAVNVSLLVLAQARSFGIQGSMLHAFGMAALLHDVGKLMVPLPVLNRPGKLEGEDWRVMQSHAEQGAWYLSETEGATPLSIVVAYEHHLRYDGKPNYPVTRPGRIPNLATRMTSIADSYDALSTQRPYSKPRARATAVQLLRDRVNTFYDPLLLANFIQMIGEAR
jgi:HD-GYP domain-containing protein (c-di-GMP phosphodiesterase class II)